ncbi:MAG TPA: hypothetical protein VJC14_00950 [Candidatus Paceibacterota bacterium]
MQFHNLQKNGGYTIIETMVSISIFLVVVMYGMAALLNANVVQRKLQDMHSIIDNMSFIMEDISRNLRTGYNIKCFQKNVDTILSTATISASPTTRSCTDGWAIAFEPTFGHPSSYTDQWVYYLDSSGKLWKSTQGVVAGSSIQLTPDEVVIDQISGFSVLGAVPVALGDSQQPMVTIRLSGNITYKPGTPNSIVSPFSLQTSVSQRAIDI